MTLNSGKGLEEDTCNKGTQDHQAAHYLSLLSFNIAVLLS